VALQLLSTAPALPVKARAHAETPTSTAFLDSQRNNSRLSAGPYSNIPTSHIAIRSKASAASATKQSAYPETTVRSTGDLVRVDGVVEAETRLA
jgi:hypothetical protein